MILFILMFLLLLFFPQITHDGIKNGLLLLENQVIPSLYPFILLSAYLRNKCNTKNSSFLLLTSFLSGYPIGAKIISENEFKSSFLSKQNLLLLCNMPSPSFLLSYVGYHCLNQPTLSLLIFLSIIIGNICTILLQNIHQTVFRHKNSPAPNRILHNLNLNNSYNTTNSTSMPQEAFSTLLTISTYILVFNIAAVFIQKISFLKYTFKSFLIGLFEITTGIKQLADAPINLQWKLMYITGLLSFGGFSIILQTKSMIESSDLSIKKYMTDKAISSCIAMSVMYGFTLLFKLNIN